MDTPKNNNTEFTVTVSYRFPNMLPLNTYFIKLNPHASGSTLAKLQNHSDSRICRCNLMLTVISW